MIAEVVVVDDTDPNSGADENVSWAFRRDTNRSFFDTECIMVEPLQRDTT
jgi:hypothetical protein